MHFVRVYVVYPYSSIDTVTAWKKSCFILSDRLDFHMIDNLSIAVHAFMRLQFLWGDHTWGVFAPSSLCIWNQMTWRNLQTIVLPWDFLLKFLRCFDRLSKSMMLWISLKAILIFPKNFLNFRFDIVEKQSIIYLSSYRSMYYASVVLGDSEVPFLKEGEDTVFCPFP